MEWIKLTPENYKDLKEVLATNGSDYLVGYIWREGDGTFNCEDDHQMLNRCTHYCTLTKAL